MPCTPAPCAPALTHPRPACTHAHSHMQISNLQSWGDILDAYADGFSLIGSRTCVLYLGNISDVLTGTLTAYVNSLFGTGLGYYLVYALYKGFSFAVSAPQSSSLSVRMQPAQFLKRILGVYRVEGTCTCDSCTHALINTCTHARAHMRMCMHACAQRKVVLVIMTLTTCIGYV